MNTNKQFSASTPFRSLRHSFLLLTDLTNCVCVRVCVIFIGYDVQWQKEKKNSSVWLVCIRAL